MTTQAQKDAIVAAATQLKSAIDALTPDAVVAPPPVLTLGDVQYQNARFDPLNSMRLLPQLALSQAWYDTRMQYTRYQTLVRIKQAVGTLEFRVTDQDNGGGAGVGFQYPTYALEIDGKEVGRTTVTSAQKVAGIGMMPHDVTGFTSGIHEADIIPYDAGGNRITNGTEWSVHMAEIWIDLDGTAKDFAYAVARSGNYELQNPGRGETTRIATPLTVAWWKFPVAAIAKQPAPALPAWVEPPAITAFRTGIIRENVTPSTEGGDLSTHIPCMTKEGYITLANRHAYFWGDLIAAVACYPVLDGLPGIATTTHTTAILPGRDNHMYGTDRRAWAYRGDKVSTMFGHRSKNQQFPRHWEDATADDYELIGDWSAVAAAGLPCRLYLCWAFFFDPRTTGIDPNSPLVDGQHTHPTDVHGFWATEDGMILRTTHSGTSHDAVVKVEPWIWGLNGSWGMEWRVMPDGTMEIYVTQQESHLVSVYSGDTPNTKLRDWSAVAAPSAKLYGTTVNDLRTWVPAGQSGHSSQAAASLRSTFPTQTVCPQGLAWYDKAKTKLVVFSYALGEPRLYDAQSGAFLGVVCRPFISYGNKSHYMSGAVCTGLNGPEGTVFVCTFAEQANFGMAECFPVKAGNAPDGAFAKRSVTSDGTTAILGTVYPSGTVITVYDALNTSGTVTGTYASQDAAQRANGTPLTNVNHYDWEQHLYDVNQGSGGRSMAGTYPTCIGLNPERPVMLLGDTQDGIKRFRAPYPGEAVITDDATAVNAGIKIQVGAQYFRSKQYQRVFGSQAMRRNTDKALPFGENAALDATLKAWGHSP